jgi:transposase-like protein
MPEPKKPCTPEFRDEAVRLAQTSGRSRREVAADLGIGPHQRERLKRGGGPATFSIMTSSAPFNHLAPVPRSSVAR